MHVQRLAWLEGLLEDKPKPFDMYDWANCALGHAAFHPLELDGETLSFVDHPDTYEYSTPGSGGVIPSYKNAIGIEAAAAYYQIPTYIAEDIFMPKSYAKSWRRTFGLKISPREVIVKVERLLASARPGGR